MIRGIIDSIIMRVSLFILGVLIALMGLITPYRALYGLHQIANDILKDEKIQKRKEALDALTKCKDC